MAGDACGMLKHRAAQSASLRDTARAVVGRALCSDFVRRAPNGIEGFHSEEESPQYQISGNYWKQKLRTVVAAFIAPEH